MKLLSSLALVVTESLRNKLLKKLEPTVNLHWAAYCGSDAQLRSTQKREDAAHSNYASMARDWREAHDAYLSHRKQNADLISTITQLREAHDILLRHSNSVCLETWRASCLEQGINLDAQDHVVIRKLSDDNTDERA